MSTTSPRCAAASVLGAPFALRTYRNLSYLLLALPLGLCYVVVLSVGVPLTLGLSLTLLGPLALLATLLVTLTLSWLDARLAGRLLGVDLPGPSFPADADGPAAYAVALLTARDTWAGTAYLCWRVVFAVAAFALLTTGFSLALGLLAAPLAYGEFLVVDYRFGRWTVDTLPRAAGAAGAGLLVGGATLVCGNLLVAVGRAVTAFLFGTPDAETHLDSER